MKQGITLLEIQGSSCAGCVSLHQEVINIISKYPQLTYRSVSMDQQEKEIREWIAALKIEKVPTLILCDGDHEIARVSGYQPAEILDVWLEMKLAEISEK
ncbi:MAG: thioredoxin family protein [Erysipelotrichaceae bacterium]|nr:thioredoxin family protein [Erysipelotrichaceae bacterium]